MTGRWLRSISSTGPRLEALIARDTIDKKKITLVILPHSSNATGSFQPERKSWLNKC